MAVSQAQVLFFFYWKTIKGEGAIWDVRKFCPLDCRPLPSLSSSPSIFIVPQPTFCRPPPHLPLSLFASLGRKKKEQRKNAWVIILWWWHLPLFCRKNWKKPEKASLGHWFKRVRFFFFIAQTGLLMMMCRISVGMFANGSFSFFSPFLSPPPHPFLPLKW